MKPNPESGSIRLASVALYVAMPHTPLSDQLKRLPSGVVIIDASAPPAPECFAQTSPVENIDDFLRPKTCVPSVRCDEKATVEHLRRLSKATNVAISQPGQMATKPEL